MLLRSVVLGVITLVAVGCNSSRSRDPAASVGRALGAVQEAAAAVIASEHGVSAEEVRIDAEAHRRWFHQPEMEGTILKWRIGTERNGTIGIGSDGEVLDLKALELEEASFIGREGLRMSPSLRAEFTKHPEEQLDVWVSFIPTAGLQFASWDEESSINIEALLAQRADGVSRMIEEAHAHEEALVSVAGADVLERRLSAVRVRITEVQARAIAMLEFIADLSLAPEESERALVPLLAPQNQTTGIASFSTSHSTSGAGIGVLLHEEGAPWSANVPFFEQYDLADFVLESGNTGVDQHARGVFAILAKSDPVARGTAPQARFGVFATTYVPDYNQAIAKLTSLTVKNNTNTGPYWVYNGSYGLKRDAVDTATVLGPWSLHFDSLAWATGMSFVFGNGNIPEDYADSSRVATPANAFNVIAVGGTDSAQTLLDPSDDPRDPDSAYLPPPSTHGDRVKPDISAPFTVQPLVGPYLEGGSGTSLSAPLITGLVAQLMEVSPIALVRPDYVKALLIANASPIANPGPSDLYGQVNGVRLAGSLPWGSVRGRSITRTASCSDIRLLPNVVNLKPDDAFPVRVAMAWLSSGSTGTPTNEPFHDLDLSVVQSSTNTVVASSARFDSTIELVEFVPEPGEEYVLRVSARRCNLGMIPFTIAWASAGSTLAAASSTLGAAANP